MGACRRFEHRDRCYNYGVIKSTERVNQGLLTSAVAMVTLQSNISKVPDISRVLVISPLVLAQTSRVVWGSGGRGGGDSGGKDRILIIQINKKQFYNQAVQCQFFLFFF